MRALLPLLLIAAPVTAQAQVTPQPTPPQPTTLSVAADARVERAPDVADISAGVVTQAATASEAMTQNAARMSAVVAALKRAGVADRDVQTAGINLNPQYVYRENQPPQLTGYQASNNVSVQIRKITDMGRVIDALVGQGSNQINGPTFRLDRPDPALDEARTAAVAKARARADLYARAAGMRVKRILSISEGPAFTPPPYPIPIARMEAMDAKASTPVAAGEVRLQANVNVVFELE